ncbi:hypothetical protein A0H81_07726 [Grifola frondosa]|uniref:Secreted protein n=1 Tax=Grifola frondosa TaxID=5627 RepID=A0A1C7M745_GRIFR|nr:hypothetical protein A0H81_07726 [Grifola frondosa]
MWFKLASAFASGALIYPSVIAKQSPLFSTITYRSFQPITNVPDPYRNGICAISFRNIYPNSCCHIRPTGSTWKAMAIQHDLSRRQ